MHILKKTNDMVIACMIQEITRRDKLESGHITRGDSVRLWRIEKTISVKARNTSDSRNDGRLSELVLQKKNFPG